MKLFSSNNPAGLQPREHRALYVLLSFFLPALVLTLALIGLGLLLWRQNQKRLIIQGG